VTGAATTASWRRSTTRRHQALALHEPDEVADGHRTLQVAAEPTTNCYAEGVINKVKVIKRGYPIVFRERRTSQA